MIKKIFNLNSPISLKDYLHQINFFISYGHGNYLFYNLLFSIKYNLF